MRSARYRIGSFAEIFLLVLMVIKTQLSNQRFTRIILDGMVPSVSGLSYVSANDFNDPSFRDAHADYLLGEIRDQLLFYYSQDEFDLFLQFFSHLRGKKKFSYDEFIDAFTDFIADCTGGSKPLPQFFESADGFLQFLYEQNVVCYIERDDEDERSEQFIRWCFRERTPSNLAPKVRTHVEYEIFYGLTKALNVGRANPGARTGSSQNSRDGG